MFKLPKIFHGELEFNKYQKLFLFFFLLSIICLVIVYFLSAYLDPFSYFIIEHFGVTFALFVFVVVIFEMYLRTDAKKELEAFLTKKFQEFSVEIKKDLNDDHYELSNKIKQDINLFKENFNELTIDVKRNIKFLNDLNIKDIFTKRRDSKDRILRIFSTIQAQIESPQTISNEIIEIDILGITLKDFTKGPYHNQISDIINSPGLLTYLQNNKIILRMLYQYPYANSAIARSIREEFEVNKEKYNRKTIINFVDRYNEQSGLFKDSLNSAINIFGWKKQITNNPNLEFQVKLCTYNPMVHILRLNNSMFVEPYHLGMTSIEPKEYEYHRLRENKAIGQILMIHIDKNISEGFWQDRPYEVLKNHFDFLWEHPTTIKFDDGIKVDERIINYLTPDNLPDRVKEAVCFNLTIYEKFS